MHGQNHIKFVNKFISQFMRRLKGSKNKNYLVFSLISVAEFF